MTKERYYTEIDGIKYYGDVSEPDATLTALEYADKNGIPAHLSRLYPGMLVVCNHYISDGGIVYDLRGNEETSFKNVIDAVDYVWKQKQS